MVLPKINIHDGKHVPIIAEEGERVLTPEQNKTWEMQHKNDADFRREPMHANVYDDGGDVANKDTSAAIANMPGQVAPQFGTQTTPLMDQFDKGGDVKAEPSVEDRISARAKELYDQSKAVSAPLLGENAGAIQEQGQMLRTDMGNAPDTRMKMNYAPVEADRVNPEARYGMRFKEQRLDPQGNAVDPSTPQGMNAAGPKLPVPSALYDKGGDITSRAQDVFKEAKAGQDDTAEGLRQKAKTISELSPKPPAPEPAYVPSVKDRTNIGPYGMRRNEQRLRTDPQGNIVDPSTPQGMGASGPKQPVPSDLYDEGGTVGRIKKIFSGTNDAKGVDEKQKNVEEYNSATAESNNKDRPADVTTPEGMGVKPIQRPAEPKELDYQKVYDEGGDVSTDDEAAKAAAHKQAADEILNESKGAPADFGGPVLPNPKGIKPQMDTDTPKSEPNYKMQGAKMNNLNYFKGDMGMNTQNANPPGQSINDPQVPLRDTGEGQATPVISEASTKPTIAAPRPTAMKTKGQDIEAPLGNGTTDVPMDQQKNEESAKNAGYPVQHIPKEPGEEPKVNPEHMAIIQKDKEDAMRSGDLVKLGMANINERTLKAGGAPEQPTPVAPSAEDNLKNQRKELKHKMLNGQTEQERFQAEKDLAELNRKSPWGSEGNHPGLLGKIAHGVSTVAQGLGQGIAPYAVNAIPGSQGQLAEQEARGEQGVEDAQKKEQQAAVTSAQEQKPELQQEQQRITEEKNKMQHDAQLRQRGYKTDASGAEVPIPYEELSTHEQGVFDLNNAKANAQNALAELKQAQADPTSPQSQLILAKAKAEGEKMDQAGQKLGLAVDTYKAQYLGLDHNNNPLPGVQTTPEGKPVGTKVGAGAGKGKITANQSMKADLAENVVHNVDQATKLIRANPDLFGKVSGRFTSAAQMIGSNDKAIAQLGTIIHNTAMATNGIHGLRSAQAIEGTEKELINKFRNSPEATISALKENRRSVEDFLKDGGKPLIADPDLVPKGASAEVLDKSGNVTGHVVNNKYVPLPKE